MSGFSIFISKHTGKTNKLIQTSLSADVLWGGGRKKKLFLESCGPMSIPHIDQPTNAGQFGIREKKDSDVLRAPPRISQQSTSERECNRNWQQKGPTSRSRPSDVEPVQKQQTVTGLINIFPEEKIGEPHVFYYF